MPLCGKKSKSNVPSVQKVVIPRGMIDPSETTVIEIPAKLHKQPVVIAKRKTSAKRSNHDIAMSSERSDHYYSFNPSAASSYYAPQQPQQQVRYRPKVGGYPFVRILGTLFPILNDPPSEVEQNSVKRLKFVHFFYKLICLPL